jgi:hypothetical protein
MLKHKINKSDELGRSVTDPTLDGSKNLNLYPTHSLQNISDQIKLIH